MEMGKKRKKKNDKPYYRSFFTMSIVFIKKLFSILKDKDILV